MLYDVRPANLQLIIKVHNSAVQWKKKVRPFTAFLLKDKDKKINFYILLKQNNVFKKKKHIAGVLTAKRDF